MKSRRPHRHEPKEPLPGESFSWFGFSLRSVLLILLGILLFALYVTYLITGNNSLMVLRSVEKEKRTLLSEKDRLLHENQRLQKKYFELLQITGE